MCFPIHGDFFYDDCFVLAMDLKEIRFIDSFLGYGVLCVKKIMNYKEFFHVSCKKKKSTCENQSTCAFMFLILNRKKKTY